jgi:heme-degrading monooxygenase HmoA
MFARKVSVRLKPTSLREFVTLMEHEILPWLRKQPGFLELIILALPDGSEVATISFWDQERNAHAFNTSGYPQALEVLDQILDGIPYVKTFEVVSSTFQTLVRARPDNSNNLLPRGGTVPLTFRSCETNV